MGLVWGWSDHLQEVVLGLIGALLDCFHDIVWERWLENDIVVKVIFEIFSTLAATVTIVDTKNLKFWPLIVGHSWGLDRGLNHVEDDRDPVLICLPDSTNVCICCESFD